VVDAAGLWEWISLFGHRIFPHLVDSGCEVQQMGLEGVFWDGEGMWVGRDWLGVWDGCLQVSGCWREGRSCDREGDCGER
jgi:hypothetical protein